MVRDQIWHLRCIFDYAFFNIINFIWKRKYESFPDWKVWCILQCLRTESWWEKINMVVFPILLPCVVLKVCGWVPEFGARILIVLLSLGWISYCTVLFSYFGVLIIHVFYILHPFFGCPKYYLQRIWSHLYSILVSVI